MWSENATGLDFRQGNQVIAETCFLTDITSAKAHNTGRQTGQRLFSPFIIQGKPRSTGYERSQVQQVEALRLLPTGHQTPNLGIPPLLNSGKLESSDFEMSKGLPRKPGSPSSRTDSSLPTHTPGLPGGGADSLEIARSRGCLRVASAAHGPVPLGRHGPAQYLLKPIKCTSPPQGVFGARAHHRYAGPARAKEPREGPPQSKPRRGRRARVSQ